jgi:hypothetical protein
MNERTCDFRFAICDLLRKAAVSVTVGILTADYEDFADRKTNLRLCWFWLRLGNTASAQIANLKSQNIPFPIRVIREIRG